MSTDTLGPALDSRRVPAGPPHLDAHPPGAAPTSLWPCGWTCPRPQRGRPCRLLEPTPLAPALGDGFRGVSRPICAPLQASTASMWPSAPSWCPFRMWGHGGGAGSPAPPAPPPGSLPPFTTGAQSCGPVQGTRPGEHSSSAPCPGRGVAPRLPRESAPLDREATGCCQLSATTRAGPAREVGGAGEVQDPSLQTESSLGVNTPAGAVCAPGSHADLGGGRRASGCCAGHRRVVGSKGWAACSRAILQEMRGHYGAARLRPA